METFITNHFLQFFLLFVRMTTFVVVVPLFSYRTIPVQYKIIFSFFFSLLLYPIVKGESLTFTDVYVLLLLKEAMIGLFLGFVVFLLFSSVQVAGNILDFQIGFTYANTVDPGTGMQAPIISRVFYIWLLFFAVVTNFHHVLIRAIAYSFVYIPIEKIPALFTSPEMGIAFIQLISTLFLLGVQLALPMLIILLFVEVVLGFLTRTVPQMNIFSVGLPLKNIIFFLVLPLFLPVFFQFLIGLFTLTEKQLHNLIHLIGGSVG